MPPRKGEETEWWLVNFPPLPNPSPARGEGLKKNFDFELPSPPAGEGLKKNFDFELPSPPAGEGLKKNFDFELPSPPAGEGPGERGEANAGLNQSCCQLCTASLPCF
jgi:hypothetical protein